MEKRYQIDNDEKSYQIDNIACGKIFEYDYELSVRRFEYDLGNH